MAREMPIAAIEDAASRIAGRIVRTPVLGSRTAARRVEERTGRRLGGSSGEARLFLKSEHLQATGSFKPRGALNRVATLAADERARGLVTVSAGNHAQALAFAAASERIPVTVVMPAGASPAKAAAAAAYGAEVILHGTHVGDTFARMEQLRAERGLTFVPPFDDPLVIAGQGTVGLELVDDLPDVDVVVVAVGGGGLLSGVAAALKQMRPGVRVYGVEPVGSRALSAGLVTGSPVRVEPRSIADGLGAPFAGQWTLELTARWVDDVVLVEVRAIASAVVFALERMKQLLEPAGATALAAVLEGAIPLRDRDVVCVIASGGNLDLDRLPGIVALAGHE